MPHDQCNALDHAPPIETQPGLSTDENRGLLMALIALIGFSLLVGLLSVPPWARLRPVEAGALLRTRHSSAGWCF